MKKIKILTLVIIATLSGCKQEDLKYFEEDIPLLNIWLGTNTIIQDSITHNFAYSPTNQDAIIFNYRIAGYVTDYDRSFELVTSDPDAKLLNFTFGDYKVPAGQQEGSFILHVDKPQDEDLFKDKDLHVTFKVRKSNLFQAAPINYSTLKITFKNAVTKPANWDNAVLPYLPLVGFFGAYSDEKYKFIIQTTGYSNFNVFRTSLVNPELEPNTITHFHANALQMQCKQALDDYNEASESPKLDENDNPIVFP